MARKSLLLFLAIGILWAAEKYTGPVPPKPDIPYLLHASNLIETESGQVREETRKNDTNYVISGASSPVRTPLAEPIFIIDAQKSSPERFELYRMDVKGGNREVSLSGGGRRRGGNRPFHLAVTPLGGHLYKIEADEPLENGEYVLSPSGDNRAFCFEIY
jgi:hypothetical protein